MKPKLIEWIPFYGMFKYSRRYFTGEQRSSKEANIAQWFEMYHISTSLIITFWFLIHFKIIIPKP